MEISSSGMMLSSFWITTCSASVDEYLTMSTGPEIINALAASRSRSRFTISRSNAMNWILPLLSSTVPLANTPPLEELPTFCRRSSTAWVIRSPAFMFSIICISSLPFI